MAVGSEQLIIIKQFLSRRYYRLPLELFPNSRTKDLLIVHINFNYAKLLITTYRASVDNGLIHRDK